MKTGLREGKLFELISLPFVSMLFPGLGCMTQQFGGTAGHSGVFISFPIFSCQLCFKRSFPGTKQNSQRDWEFNSQTPSLAFLDL